MNFLELRTHGILDGVRRTEIGQMKRPVNSAWFW